MDLGNRTVSTGIAKQAIEGTVALHRLGLEGDAVVDTNHHGGEDQALYAYGQMDATFWSETLSRATPPGVFGENLRVAGIDPSQALIGERWVVGDTVVLEVTAPRIPCRVFAEFWDVPDLVSRFLSAARPGAYLRVITPGALTAGDAIRVVGRPDHGVTVAEVSRIHTAARHEAPRLLELEGIASRVRTWAEQHVGVG